MNSESSLLGFFRKRLSGKPESKVVEEETPKWKPEGPYGDVSSLDTDGGVYISSTRESMKSVIRDLGYPVKDRMFTRQDMLDAAMSLDPNQVLVAFGIDYTQDIDGFVVAMVIRDKDDMDHFFGSVRPKAMVKTTLQAIEKHRAK